MLRSSIVLGVIEAVPIGSLKVTMTLEPAATPVAPLVGTVAVIVGGVVSATTVVKVQLDVAASALPARSLSRGSVLPPAAVAV